MHHLPQDGTLSRACLREGDYERLGHAKPCGTPGCRFPDWHDGPHSTEQVARRRDLKVKVAVRRSPRLVVQPFPWQDLGPDLQAVILLQLSAKLNELLLHLARLARTFRPWRGIILRAIYLDERIDGLLSSPITALDCKFKTEPSSLQGVFWGAHEVGSVNAPVDERMRVQLRLLRPRQSPRSWKWELRFCLSCRNANGNDLTLASVCVYFIPSERLGLPRRERPRSHSSCEQQGCVFAEGTERMWSCGICMCRPVVHMNPRLGSAGKGVLTLSSADRQIFTWNLQHEEASVLRLVRSFV